MALGLFYSLTWWQELRPGEDAGRKGLVQARPFSTSQPDGSPSFLELCAVWWGCPIWRTYHLRRSHMSHPGVRGGNFLKREKLCNIWLGGGTWPPALPDEHGRSVWDPVGKGAHQIREWSHACPVPRLEDQGLSTLGAESLKLLPFFSLYPCLNNTLLNTDQSEWLSSSLRSMPIKGCRVVQTAHNSLCWIPFHLEAYTVVEKLSL